MTRVAVVALLAAGCSFAPPDLAPREPLDLSPPATEPTAMVPLDAAATKPMYRELLAVDLRTVVDVATARNLDVQQAQQRVEAQRAQLQSVTGWLFPTLAPALLYEQVDGTVRATQGNLVDVGFHTLQPYVLAQWFMNPGKVVYEIVAARKRMVASQFDERRYAARGHQAGRDRVLRPRVGAGEGRRRAAERGRGARVAEDHASPRARRRRLAG